MIESIKQSVSITGRAFGFFAERIQGMHAAAYVLGVSVLLSSLLALMRDRLLAHTFGAGIELDIYYAAFRIPDLLFVTIGSLVSAFVLIPELKARTENEQRTFLDSVFGGFAFLGVLASFIGFIFTPQILGFLYPGFAEGATLETLAFMTRIMLIQPFILGISNITASVLQSRGRFALYAVSPLLYNAGIIFGILALYPLLGFSGLAWGVVLGALLHLAVQVPTVVREGFFRHLPRPSHIPALFKTGAIAVPRALALAISQVSFTGLTALAGLLASGSIAVFTFAYNLQAVPLAIIGGSYSVAAFPVLAERFARGDVRDFVLQVSTAARHILFWSLPVIALIIVLRAHIVRVVLGSGSFDWTDTRLTAAALALFVVSLGAQGLMLLLIRGYYASGRTLVPLLISGGMAVGTVLLGALAVGVLHIPVLSSFIGALLRVEGIPGGEILGLPFAFSLASILGLCALAVHFNWQFGHFFSDIKHTLRQALIAAICAGGAAYGALMVAGPITFSSTLLSVFSRGLIGGMVGLLVAILLYRLQNSSEYAEVLLAIRERVWREAPVTASAEESEL